MDERELVREVRHARDARGSSTTDRRDNAARARAGSFGRAAALSKCVHVGGKKTHEAVWRACYMYPRNYCELQCKDEE